MGLDIVEVPLDDPASSSLLSSLPADRGCHDTGVILGDALMASCAGDDGFNVWTLDPAVDASASLENPVEIQSVSVPGVTVGHSAGFTWDGEVLIFGHEPGGASPPPARRPIPRATGRIPSTTPGTARSSASGR